MDSFAAHVIANALRAVRARPNKDKPWLLFVADFRPGALCNWIGISGNAPASFVDALQRELGAYQCESHRELARIAPYSLRPLMAISSDGIEIATGGGIERTTLDRLTPTPVRVPFSVSLQAAMQNALMSQRVNALPRAHVHR